MSIEDLKDVEHVIGVVSSKEFTEELEKTQSALGGCFFAMLVMPIILPLYLIFVVLLWELLFFVWNF